MLPAVFLISPAARHHLMGRVGTLTIDDLLEVREQTVAEYGENRVAEVLQTDLAQFNAVVQSMITDLCEVSTDRQRRYGTSADADMVELDELGTPAAQKLATGGTVGFPMLKAGRAIGWTRDYFLRTTVRDLALQYLGRQRAYLRWMQKKIQYAIFNGVNYTFIDRFRDKVDLAVKGFVNADGAEIPDGPNGEKFAGATHTHYLANNGLDNGFHKDAVGDLVEHGHGAEVRIYINRAQASGFRALDDFEAYSDPRIVYRQTDTPGQTLDLTRIDNLAIGIFDKAEVWVKPWIPADYQFTFAAGDEEKPVLWRNHDIAAVQGLRLAAELDSHPLRVDVVEAYGGAGIWSRTNGVVTYTGGAVYTQPTF